MAYFDCQIVQGSGGGIILTVQCNSVFAGEAITATDGVTTLSQTCPSSSPYEVQFNIPNVGTWTISGTYAGDSYSTQVVIPSSARLSPIPNGSTATPTAVIQTWLHCADIWDKNYTTIDQVLADSTTLLALISSNNAADYMARSTSWASSVCENSAAMTYIGANDYCANTLLADSTWRNAICNSTYFESVLNVKVPTMTSDTTPSGEASASYYNSATPPYFAFDKNNSTQWNCFVDSGTQLTNQWVMYTFTQKVKVYKAMVNPTFNLNLRVKNFYIDASDDGTTFDTALYIGSFTNSASEQTAHYYNLNPQNKRNSYRLFVVDQYGGSGEAISVNEVQFYGRA